MKTRLILASAIGALAATSALAAPQAMDPNMPGMDHAAQPAGAQGAGIVRAIDTAKGTITLQHEAIASIGWPTMTMTFKVVPPDLLKGVKVGEKVRFTLQPAGMESTVTAIHQVKP